MSAHRPDAREFVELLVDPGTWRSWSAGSEQAVTASADYAGQLARARERTGVDESIQTGEGLVHGRRVALAVSEFGFLGGSVGVAAAERLVRAIERAGAEGLPLIAAPASGGTRMQEGAIAFVQMLKISAAIGRHRASGLPYVVYLRDPTTGGVFASWGSLGHLTVAEPGALVGFLGPRVLEAHGRPIPEGVQVAENLLRHGLVDAVVEPKDLRSFLDGALDALTSAPPVAARAPSPPRERLPAASSWESVARSRASGRPSLRDMLARIGTSVTVLHGTATEDNGDGLLVAVARFGDVPCVVVGHDRGPSNRPALVGPAGLRRVRRGMRLATELGLPLVTVVDTAGAVLSRQAEEQGLAGQIADGLAEMLALPAATVCVLLGQGTGGAALALLPADRVIAAQHSWLSPLAPEDASMILHRTTARAAEVAELQGVQARDLHRNGIVDVVVAEHADAADDPADLLDRLGRVLVHELDRLLRADPGARLEARLDRYRRLGTSLVSAPTDPAAERCTGSNLGMGSTEPDRTAAPAAKPLG
ncbi:carboxyl transferase domain-containing protein [Actinomadura sp. B10D3]|uniref:carboxyl transferase domain-containing protein n=1 Tax=Actinomadura sp. B10D3 TaxID=3153557 RepID=UPI00325F1C53